MNSIRDLFGNYVLNVAILCWLSAQLLKTLLNFMKTRRFNPERLVGAGGMPSAHSASVCGVTIALARSQGFASPLFALSFLLAAIVMYDAMGVRRQAGEHAKVINMIVRKNKNYVTYMPKDKDGLKEFLGHTPKVINMIVRKNKNYVAHVPKNKDGLKEFLGHTPLEVMGGALLGILIAILLPM